MEGYLEWIKNTEGSRHFVRNGFDFNRSDFLKMVDKKLRLDRYERDYSHNLGLSEKVIKELKRSMGTSLVLMIRRDEEFDYRNVSFREKVKEYCFFKFFSKKEGIFKIYIVCIIYSKINNKK